METEDFAEAPSARADVDVVEAVRAFVAVGGQRLDHARIVVRRLSAGEPPRRVLAEALDRNEASLDELRIRWRDAGVRWPLTLITALTFVAGILIGRRTAGR
jgi:hypothetical protein